MIDVVRMQNFKCFADEDVQLGPLTLLTGVNGAGKSSVLQALLLLRQSNDQGLLQQDRFALNGELVEIGSARDALFEGAIKEEISLGVRNTDVGLVVWKVAYQGDADVLSSPDESPQPIPEGLLREPLFADRFQYLCAERIGPRTSFPVSERVVRSGRIGNRGEYAAQYLALNGAKRLTHELLKHPKATATTLMSQVEAWLDTVSPGVRVSTTPHSALDVVQVSFAFAGERDVSSGFRPTNVGFGLTYTLPVLVALLAAQPGSLLLLENPEAHLHPKGQVTIGRLLALAAKAGVQCIVETHSDHLLNGVRLAVAKREIEPESVLVHFFSRISGVHRILSPKMDARGRLDQWPEDFFDQWDKSLEALLEVGGN